MIRQYIENGQLVDELYDNETGESLDRRPSSRFDPVLFHYNPETTLYRYIKGRRTREIVEEFSQKIDGNYKYKYLVLLDGMDEWIEKKHFLYFPVAEFDPDNWNSWKKENDDAFHVDGAETFTDLKRYGMFLTYLNMYENKNIVNFQSFSEHADSGEILALPSPIRLHVQSISDMKNSKYGSTTFLLVTGIYVKRAAL